MDTVFVCRHFILVMELKDIGGEIDVDDEKAQFIRIRAGWKKRRILNPVDQVKRHKG